MHAPNRREMWAFANNEDVRRAIHAAPAAVAGPFDECSARLRYTIDVPSVIHIHRRLLAAGTHPARPISLYQELIEWCQRSSFIGLRALVYSGDHDLCVPHTSTEKWTSELDLPIFADWEQWRISDDQVNVLTPKICMPTLLLRDHGPQVAGYLRHYERLTYATVLGAGHAVPVKRPREALALFSRFLNGWKDDIDKIMTS